MAQPDSGSSRAQSEAEKGYDTLSVLAWIAVGILCLNVSVFVTAEVGGVLVNSPEDWIDVANGFLIGLLKAGPTIFIALALMDFASFFQRCGKGEVFTERNVKTLKSGAESLILAAVVSGIVKPAVLSWIGETGDRGMIGFTDLALGVGLMGFALLGFASVLKDAVALKLENDEFV